MDKKEVKKRKSHNEYDIIKIQIKAYQRRFVMTQINYSTKHIKNKHLTIKERAQIELLVKQGTKKTEIAKIIGISRSTLYNELNKGTVEQMDTNLKIHK